MPAISALAIRQVNPRCDEEIAPLSLQVDPAATLCIRCADAAEAL
jgi:RNA polymerase-binding transcription factor DksA